jgi:ribokinase
VAVVGSLNLDQISHVPHAPRPGETVLAAGYGEHPGGKGLNQAVSAAQTTTTALVGCVGDDEAARIVREHARRASVEVSEIHVVAVPTGRAFITLDPGGDNMIIVAPLANAALAAESAIASLDRLRPTIVLMQFEIPVSVVEAVGRWCIRHGVRLVVNPSPVREFPEWLLRNADPLIVNEGEAEAVVGRHGNALSLAQVLAERARSVVVTAGSTGAVVAAGDTIEMLPAPSVTVRDTSGAGDSFAGQLAGRLAEGDALVDAVAAAVTAAAHTVASSREERLRMLVS